MTYLSKSDKPLRKGGRQPMITRAMVNERLRQNGYSDPDGMSESERFDAIIRHMVRVGPFPMKKTNGEQRPKVKRTR